jgi:peptide chain release factor subunit 3
MPMVTRKLNAPLMMPVSEKYKDMGTIVVGKIESGLLKKGDTLTLMPNKDTVEVSAVYNEMEDEIMQALCGDNVRIRLRGVEDEDISPGFVLTSPTKPIHAVRLFEAQLAILEHKSIICAGYSAVMHIHTLAEEVTLSVHLTLSSYFVNLLISTTHRPFSIISTKLQAANRRSPHNSQRKV